MGFSGAKLSGKIVTFGEIMLRLQPPRNLRFAQAEGFDLCFGGGEANVAVSLANFGEDAVFFTKLPKNQIAQRCISELKSFGVDTSLILRGGDRMGVYFCEKGTSVRPSVVIYDRANSSVNFIKNDELNGESLLNNAAWFHYTGITPALSEGAKNTLLQILTLAKKRGVVVSCDLNFRKKLWTSEDAKKTMTELMQFTDVLISNEEDCKMVFGLEALGADAENNELSVDGYKNLADKVFNIFPNISVAAFTLRGSISATANTWQGVICKRGGDKFASKKYHIDPITDRIGGGDSFAAGVIYALKNGRDLQHAIDFAIAASCLKHTIEGDFNMVSLAEVEELMLGSGSGRVQR